MNEQTPVPLWLDSQIPPVRRASRAYGMGRRVLDCVARILHRLLARKRTLAMPTTLDVREHDEEFTLETPAMGEAFSFMIKVRCSWSVKDTVTQAEHRRMFREVQNFAEQSRLVTQARLEEPIRRIARQFPPYRAAEAEAALNKELVGFLDDGDAHVTVRVWVDVCDSVRKKLENAWTGRLEEDTAGEKQKAHVQFLRDLQQEWQQLLISGLEGIGAVPEAKASWLAPYALALAENPKGAAEQLRKVLEARVDQTEKLLMNLSQTALDDRLDAIQFVYGSESTLRALLVYLGVPVPSENGTSAEKGRNDT